MHLINSYCKLRAIDNASLGLNFTSVFVLYSLLLCWGENPWLAPGEEEILQAQGKFSLENAFFLNHTIMFGLSCCTNGGVGILA